MQRALSELENDGLVISNRTAGRTVTTDQTLLEQRRNQLAMRSIEDFKAEMISLGFTIDEVIKLMASDNE